MQVIKKPEEDPLALALMPPFPSVEIDGTVICERRVISEDELEEAIRRRLS